MAQVTDYRSNSLSLPSQLCSGKHSSYFCLWTLQAGKGQLYISHSCNIDVLPLEGVPALCVGLVPPSRQWRWGVCVQSNLNSSAQVSLCIWEGWGKTTESKQSADVAVLTFSDNSQKYVVEF